MIEQQYNQAKSLLAARLYAPYQQEGVLWMLTMEKNEGRPKGGFLCDEMGLGKFYPKFPNTICHSFNFVWTF